MKILSFKSPALLVVVLASTLSAQQRDATVTNRQTQPPETVTNNATAQNTEIESRF